MQLLMIRHARPERSIDTADPGLTDLGRRQAAQLRHAAHTGHLARIFVSPQRRALETAEPLSRQYGIVPEIEPGLAEYDVDYHRYIPFHEAAQKDPDTYQRIRSGLLPRYVDSVAFRARVMESVQWVTAQAEHDDTVAVMTHGGVINALLQHILGLEKPMTFALEYVSISRVLVSRDGTMKVASVNETSHVGDEFRDRRVIGSEAPSNSASPEHARRVYGPEHVATHEGTPSGY